MGISRDSISLPHMRDYTNTERDMTDRALWVAAKQDYGHALAIAQEAWGEAADPQAVQAAAATILIHVTKLRGEERIHVKVPQSTAPAAAAQSSVAVPPCPTCGGEMWDNRGKKKNPKAADFTCKQKNGECMSKGYKTGVWIKDLAKSFNNTQTFTNTQKPVPAGSFDEIPAALEDNTDDLPF